jgi:HD-GYP domain-containing protein (c-di-GMP phosphodiesterase class II)
MAETGSAQQVERAPAGTVGLRTYIGVLLALAVTLVASWAYWSGFDLEIRFVLGATVFACLVTVGDVFPLRISERQTTGTWDIGLLLAVVTLGPDWAALVALPSALLVGRSDALRTAYEVGHSVVIVYLAGIVFSTVSAPLFVGQPESFAPVLYGTVLAGVTLLAANDAISGTLLKIKYNQRFSEHWKELVEPYLLSDVVSVLTASFGVLALLVYGPMAALVVIGGSIGSQALVHRSREQVKEIRELRARVGSLEESLTISNTVFGTMVIEDLGRRDGYTHRHAAATSVYAADLAREMKLDDVRAERLGMAGLLHNVGMFSLPEELLTATGRLNSIAQSRLAEHPARGEEALAAVPEFAEMASWVRWHHERPDGRGYPDKLRGAWIPLEAKILAVAQAYAAAILDKPSRPGTSPAEARTMLAAGADTEFDGVVVRAFLRILDTGSEGYRMADDHRFAFPAPRAGRRPGGDVEDRGREDLAR